MKAVADDVAYYLNDCIEVLRDRQFVTNDMVIYGRDNSIIYNSFVCKTLGCVFY